MGGDVLLGEGAFAVGEAGVQEAVGDAVGEGVDVADLDDQAAAAWHGLGHPLDGGGDDAAARGHRLQRGDCHALPVGGGRDDVGGGEPGVDVGADADQVDVAAA